METPVPGSGPPTPADTPLGGTTPTVSASSRAHCTALFKEEKVDNNDNKDDDDDDEHHDTVAVSITTTPKVAAEEATAAAAKIPRCLQKIPTELFACCGHACEEHGLNPVSLSFVL